MRTLLYALAVCAGLSVGAGCDDDADPSTVGGRPDMGRQLVTDMAPPDAEVLDFAMQDMFSDAAPRDAEVPDLADLPDSGRPPICLDLPPPPPMGQFNVGPRCEQSARPKIKDIRDPRCPGFQNLPDRQPGVEATIEGVVSAVYPPDAFTVQDPEGGAYSGLWVFDRSRVAMEDISPGSRVRLSGDLIEFFTLTELILDPDGFEMLGQTEAPEPIVLSDPALVADDGQLAEQLESMLVQVGNVTVTSTAPDCPSEFGMFVVTGDLRVDDEAAFDYQASRGDVIEQLTGVVHFSFDHNKILPRGDDDIVWTWCGGAPDKCEAAECPVEPDAPESGELIITEIQNNPSGDDLTREYVELFNPGPNALMVNNWQVQDCGGRAAVLTGSIPSRGYYVLGASRNEAENGGVEADTLMQDLFLPNGGGSVLIFNAEGGLVDQVRYEASDPWPRRDPGEALELVEPAADNREGQAWAPGERRYGDGGRGTPGGPYRR